MEEKNPIPQPDANVAVLDVSPFDADHEALAEIFHNSNWTVSASRTYAEAIAFLKRRLVPVIVCERDLPDGNWEDILEGALNADQPPAVIVTSRLADERLWSEVLNRGGYNVLLKPFRRPEVLRDVYLAWQHWKQQQQRVARISKPRLAGGGAA